MSLSVSFCLTDNFLIRSGEVVLQAFTGSSDDGFIEVFYNLPSNKTQYPTQTVNISHAITAEKEYKGPLTDKLRELLKEEGVILMYRRGDVSWIHSYIDDYDPDELSKINNLMTHIYPDVLRCLRPGDSIPLFPFDQTYRNHNTFLTDGKKIIGFDDDDEGGYVPLWMLPFVQYKGAGGKIVTMHNFMELKDKRVFCFSEEDNGPVISGKFGEHFQPLTRETFKQRQQLIKPA